MISVASFRFLMSFPGDQQPPFTFHCSAALVLFTYATQPTFVAILILALTCFSSFGLLAVSSWLAGERWTFSKYRGRQWSVSPALLMLLRLTYFRLGNILAEVRSRFLRITGLYWCSTQVRRKATTIRQHVQRAAAWRGSSISRVISGNSEDRDSEDEESTIGAMFPPPSSEGFPIYLRRPSDAPSARSLPPTPPMPMTPLNSPNVDGASPLSAGTPDSPEPPSSPGTSAARSRFAQIGWKVARLRSAASPCKIIDTKFRLMYSQTRTVAHPLSPTLGLGLGPPKRQMTKATTLQSDHGTPRPRRDTLNEPTLLRRARYAALIPPLKGLSYSRLHNQT